MMQPTSQPSTTHKPDQDPGNQSASSSPIVQAAGPEGFFTLLTGSGVADGELQAFERATRNSYYLPYGILERDAAWKRLPADPKQALKELRTLMQDEDQHLAISSAHMLVRHPEIPFERKVKAFRRVIEEAEADSAIREYATILLDQLENRQSPLQLASQSFDAAQFGQIDFSRSPISELIAIASNGPDNLRGPAIGALESQLHELKPGQLIELNAASHDSSTARDFLKKASFRNVTRVVSTRVILYNQENPQEVVLREGASGEWSLPGGKVGIIGKSENIRIETPLESLLREGSEEVSSKIFSSLEDLERQAEPFTVLVTPKGRWLKEKAELVGLDANGFKELGKRRWSVPRPWTQVYLLPYKKFKDTTQEGRTVKVVNLESLSEAKDIRSAHFELLFKYRQAIKEGAPVSPFTVYSGKRER